MRVPMKVDYGVRALVELALQPPGQPVPTAVIAARQGIPEPYLDQLLTLMGKLGYVRSRRGPHGGHVLAKSPSDVSLGMVMASLEGSAPPLDCLEDPDECVMSPTCAQRDVWRGVEEAVQTVLNATTVADLVDRQRAMSGRLEQRGRGGTVATGVA